MATKFMYLITIILFILSNSEIFIQAIFEDNLVWFVIASFFNMTNHVFSAYFFSMEKEGTKSYKIWNSLTDYWAYVQIVMIIGTAIFYLGRALPLIIFVILGLIVSAFIDEYNDKKGGLKK